jgi:tight adherence protein B
MSVSNALVSGFHRVQDALSGAVTAVGNHVGPLTVAALVLGTTLLAAYVVVMVFLRPRNDLAEILEPYRLHRAPVPPRPEAGPIEVKLPVLRRAAELLSVMAEDRGLRPAIEQRLVRAALPLGTGEFLLFAVAGVVVLGLVGLLLGGLFGLIVGMVLGVVGPPAVLQVLVERQTRRFAAQLPDVLKLLAGSLRAGFSLLQGLDAVVEQVTDPIERELRRALAAARLGVPIEDALAEVAERVGSRDFAWTVMAVRIQREVGGNLAQILDTVWDTMIQRQRLRREVKTLTAEGRISAIILAALPVVLGGFIYLVNRPYMRQLFDTLPGQMMLLGAVAFELIGTWWMYRTIQIEL